MVWLQPSSRSLTASVQRAWWAALLALVAIACSDDARVVPTVEPTDAEQSGGDLGLDDAPDATAEDTAPDSAADASDTDQADADAQGDAAPSCPGGAGCACAQNEACDSAICLETPDGKQCAKLCTTECPKGYACKAFGGTDQAFVCVPQMLSLCAPCKANSECAVQGSGALCLDYGAEGKFCGAACAAANDCPTGYACQDEADGTGKTVKQCRLSAKTQPGSGQDCTADAKSCPAGESCSQGKCAVVTAAVCGCSNWATGSGLATECSKTNSFGTCKAARKCMPEGLGACGAKAPEAEVCNAIDDDCDGNKDNLAKDFTCVKEAFQDGGSGGPCTKDADCTAAGEGCDEKAAACKKLIGQCAGKPTCAANGELICNDAKTPKIEQCNAEDDDCDGLIDEDFGWPLPTDPSQVVGVGKACGLGPCAGGKVKCQGLFEAICDSAPKAKTEGCDEVDNDCDGVTDDLACEDNNACTIDTCDGPKGKCSYAPGNDCNDKDQCTTDSCNPNSGKCVFEEFLGSCDDKDKCTVGDSCQKGAGGKAICIPGANPAKCDDANVCTDDSCAADKGCVNLANAATESCYAGAPATLGVGNCHAGVRSCVGSVLGGTCVGEVVPTKTELCDVLDDTCNGQTDEGCLAAQANLTFSSAHLQGGGGGGGTQVQAFFGPSGFADVLKADKQTSAILGFLAWLLTWTK